MCDKNKMSTDKESEVEQWVQFRERKQLEVENINMYADSLRVIAQRCQFGDALDKSLRDQFVYGIRSNFIRTKLYTDGKTLPFKDVYEMAISLEAEKELDSPAQLKRILSNRNALLEEPTYELERFKENKLIIFNHEEFTDRDSRNGTQQDVTALKNTFRKFGFDIDVHKNFNKDEIFATLEAFTDSRNDLSDYGCVAVAILTHGSSNGLLRAKDKQYGENEIIERLKDYNNPTLATKPRVIIIQACRGNEDPIAVNVNYSGTEMVANRDEDEQMVQHNIVPGAMDDNMLIMHSCYAGNPSYLNKVDGSWFIEELCKKIEKLAPTHDILTIMCEVKHAIAINKEYVDPLQKTPDKYICKQIPVIANTLVRKLFLKKYGEMPNKSSSCFLNLYFNFMKICLRNYIEVNPDDETAAMYFELANNDPGPAEVETRFKNNLSEAILRYLLKTSLNYPSSKNVQLVINVNT